MTSEPRDLPARPPDTSVEATSDALRRTFPSGRSLDLRIGSHQECIEVRSANGDLELSITLTDDGPVFKLRGARLEIDSTDAVAVRCRSFELATEDSLSLHSGGSISVNTEDEIRMRSAQQTFIDGDYVNLNCLDRTGYHDEDAALAEPPEEPESTS